MQQPPVTPEAELGEKRVELEDGRRRHPNVLTDQSLKRDV